MLLLHMTSDIGPARLASSFSNLFRLPAVRRCWHRPVPSSSASRDCLKLTTSLHHIYIDILLYV